MRSRTWAVGVALALAACRAWGGYVSLRIAEGSVDVENGAHSPGDEVDVSVSVANTGTETSGDLTMQWYASANTTLSDEDWLLGSVEEAGVGASSVARYEQTVALPTAMPTGTYYVGVVVVWDRDPPREGVDPDPIGVVTNGNGGVPRDAGAIAGRVIDADTGHAIPGAHVRWGEWPAVTDEAGGFAWTGLPCGTRRLCVEADGYASSRSWCEAPCGTEVSTQVCLRVLPPLSVTRVRMTRAVPAGRMEILFDLEGPGDRVSVGLACATNASGSFEPVDGAHGPGIGEGVLPGPDRRIVWDGPEADSPASGTTGWVARVMAVADEASSTGWVACITLTDDIARAEAPRVDEVYGESFDGRSHVYFLAGVAAEQRIRADIDWRGAAPGQVRFAWSRGRRQGREDSVALDIGADLAEGDGLWVTAIAADGRRSAPHRANFDVIPPPLGLTGAEVALTGLDPLRYEVSERSIAALCEGVDRVGDRRIPAFGGHAFAMDVDMSLALEISGEGMAHGVGITAAGEGFTVAGQALTPRLAGAVRLQWEPDVARWMPAGHISMGVDMHMQTPPWYVWASPPVYLRGTAAASADVTLLLEGWDERRAPEWNGEVPFQATARLFAGWGAGRLGSAEGYVGGGGRLWAQYPHTPHLRELWVTLEGGVRASFLAWEWEPQPLRYHWDLLAGSGGSGGENGWPPATAPASFLAAPDSLQLMARSVMTTSGGAVTGESWEVSFGRPSPALVTTALERWIWWVDDAPERSYENRTRLLARHGDGTVWSPVEPVWDDGTADFAPSASGLADGAAVVAWANMGRTLEDGCAAEEAPAFLEIAAAWRLPGSDRWRATNLTADASADTAPVVAGDGGDRAVVAWVSMFPACSWGGSGCAQQLWAATGQAGTWDAPALLGSTTGRVDGVQAAWSQGNVTIVASVDEDGDPRTDDDSELYVTQQHDGAWSTWLRNTQDNLPDDCPWTWVDGTGAVWVVWRRGGRAVRARAQAELLGEAEALWNGDPDARVPEFSLATAPGGRAAIVWPDDRSGGSRGVAGRVLAGAGREWSRQLHMTRDAARGQDVCAVLDATGRLSLAYAATFDGTNWADSIRTEVMARDAILEPFIDVAEDSNARDPAVPSLDSDVRLVFRLRNTGGADSGPVRVEFLDEAPEIGGCPVAPPVRAPQGMPAGTSLLVTQVVYVTGRGWPRSVCAAVRWDDDGPGTGALAIAVASLMPGGVVLDGFRIEETGIAGRLLLARVRNTAAAPNESPIRVQFRVGDPDGEIVGEEEVSWLAAGASRDMGCRWAMDGQAWTSAWVQVWARLRDADPGATSGATGCSLRAAWVRTPLDSDGDGLADARERAWGGDPTRPDTDGDGLSDGEEADAWGTAVACDDTDGDGIPDGAEAQAGTDPLDASCGLYVRVQRTEGGGHCVWWQGRAGKAYVLEGSADGHRWEIVGDGDGRRVSFDDVVMRAEDANRSGRRYYRLRCVR